MAFPLSSSLLLFSVILGPAGLVSGGCLPSYTEVDGGCFLAIKDTEVDFVSARELCQSFSGDLAIVEDCGLLGALSVYLTSLGMGGESVWIGATDWATEGTWRWFDGREVPMGAPFWGRQTFGEREPSGGAEENCAAMVVGAGYYFQDLNCELSSGYAPLCQVLPLGDGGAGANDTCPSPYILVGGSCLEFLPTVDVSWSDAQTVCQTNGGHLAIIDDCHVMADVISYAQTHGLVPANGFWVGGSDEANEGTWTWVDGTDMAMGVPFWGRIETGPLQPNDGTDGQDCLTMGYDRQYLDDVECHRPLSPLCQSDVI